MEESNAILQQLIEKYKGDEYMTGRIHQYMHRLPKIFETIHTSHMTSQSYEEQMQNSQDTFVHNFLHSNKYYYSPMSEKFFVYDGEHYTTISEDDILHNVLTSISKNKQLLAWKKSTKIQIMCKIKGNLLVKSIPNSETIQHVLDMLHPSFFSTKAEAKYFLTIIGDAIFKKNGNLFHFILSKAKGFLQELNNYSQMYIGSNILHTFKYKYYDHDYANCRLIKIFENMKNENLWRPFISNHCIDMLCVASHYSIRYNSSDEYMMLNNDTLIEYTFYLKNKNQQMIIDTFCNEYMIVSPTDQGSNISWKNILYLWKHFLDTVQLPYIVFQQQLKQMIFQKFAGHYNESTDCFVGLCSKYMPSIHTFLQFWNDTMITCENEYDLEIEEIMMLCKRWAGEYGIRSNNINESQLIDLITYYFPEIEIENGKYIHKIKNVQWDKKQDIENALQAFRNEIALATSLSNISLYDLYEFYCKFQCANQCYMIVSKQYFEKNILENLADYIIDDSISIDWLFV